MRLYFDAINRQKWSLYLYDNDNPKVEIHILSESINYTIEKVQSIQNLLFF